MQLIPDVVPVSHLRAHHKEIFDQIEKGPVILAQRSKPAAILVSVENWNEREKYLEMLEARLKYLEMKQYFLDNPSKWFSFDEIEESVKASK